MKKATEHYLCDGQKWLLTDERGKRYRLTAAYDDFAFDPREDEHDGTIWCWKRNARIGDPTQHDNPYEALSDLLTRMHVNIDEDKSDDPDYLYERVLEHAHGPNARAVFLPIYCYEHGGMTISANDTYPYNDRWDGGQIGFAFILKDQFMRDHSVKAVLDENGNPTFIANQHYNGTVTYSMKTEPITDTNWYTYAMQVLLDEIHTLDLYIRGDVYVLTLDIETKHHEEERCPHCGEILNIKDYTTWDHIETIGNLLGETVEETGFLDNFEQQFTFVSEIEEE